MSFQVGTATETVYATAVAPNRFWEFNSETVKPVYARVQSNGLRAGQEFVGSLRHQNVPKGAAGPFNMDVPTKSFGWWLVHMLGTVATTGPTDGNYIHTGTVGPFTGDSFTWQVNRAFNPTDGNNAVTYDGGKIPTWELACNVDGLLVFNGGFDFAHEKIAGGGLAADAGALALGTATYPTAANVFTWAQGAITIGGVAAEITSFQVGATNNLKLDRFYQRNSSIKKEPTRNGLREYTWSLTMDFSDLTQLNRFRDMSAANNLAAIVATYQGPVAHAGTTLPSIVITIPAARFDAADVNIGGPEALMIALSGVATDNGSASPLSIAYTSTDVTP